MVTVCQKCGDRGIREALVYCVKCLVSAEHLYCLDELPKIPGHDVSWVCEDCVPRVPKPTTPNKPGSTSSMKTYRRCLRRAPRARSATKFKKSNITSLNVMAQALECESGRSLELHDAHLQVDWAKTGLLMENTTSLHESQGKDQVVGKKRKLVDEEMGKFHDDADDAEDVASVEVKCYQVSTDARQESDLTGPLVEDCRTIDEQPRGRTVNERFPEVEMLKTNADGSTEIQAPDCPMQQEHDVMNRSVRVEKDPEYVTENERELFIGNIDSSRSVSVIAPHGIILAIEKKPKSIEADLKVPMEHSIDMPERTAASISQPIQSGSQLKPRESKQLEKQRIHVFSPPPIQPCSELLTVTSQRSQTVTFQSAPGTTIPSASSSSMASGTDAPETETPTNQPRKVLKEVEYREGRSSPDRYSSQTIGTSVLNIATAPDGLTNRDETSSVDDSITEVAQYLVKMSLAPILRDIMKKYGDIAQDCHFHTEFMRSSILEGLCRTVQKYEAIPFKHLQDHHLKDLDSAVTDFERANLDVKWLRKRLDELWETTRQTKGGQNLKDAVAQSNERAESTKRTLNLMKSDMIQLQSDIESLEDELASLAQETEKMEGASSNVRLKFMHFYHKSLMDGLL